MKPIIAIFLAGLLCACSNPHFVADTPPVPATTVTPDHFELPARFAMARVVYGRVQPPSGKEETMWTDVVSRAEGIGSFTPLVLNGNQWSKTDTLIKTARLQRYNYLLHVEMDPSSGSADITLFHVGSGGIMATAQAVSEAGGRSGFWGGRINNPARLKRQTDRIAEAAVPVIEEMLQGVVARQSRPTS